MGSLGLPSWKCLRPWSWRNHSENVRVTKYPQDHQIPLFLLQMIKLRQPINERAQSRGCILGLYLTECTNFSGSNFVPTNTEWQIWAKLCFKYLWKGNVCMSMYVYMGVGSHWGLGRQEVIYLLFSKTVPKYIIKIKRWLQIFSLLLVNTIIGKYYFICAATRFINTSVFQIKKMFKGDS